jgi:hypothetical protein
MAANKSETLANNVINFFLRANAGSVTAPATVYAALFTVSPTSTTFGTEVSGGNYARVNCGETSAITFSAASGGASANAAAIQFPTANASWGEIKAVAILNHVSDSNPSNIIYWGALSAFKTVDSGDTVTFNTSALAIAET